MADAQTLFALFESAAGYALFEVIQFDEIASLIADSSASVTDLKRFGRAVKLKAFLGFDSAAAALENANAISEHAMTETLRDFLEVNLPAAKKSSKTSSFSLGVIDPALASAISEGLGGLSCRSDDTVREILRGCRLHLSTMIKGLSDNNDKKAQLGLGHSYSRCKVKFNPARSDNMIIQSIALLDQLDKDVNTFAMRVREWYCWHFPELKDIVKDNILFSRCAAFIQDKNSLLTSSGEGTNELDGGGCSKMASLTDILGGDSETAHAIQAAAKTSMGMDCSAVDMMNIVNFTSRMVKLAEYRKQLSCYLSDKMSIVAPNLSALIGDSVAARLISKAGSLTNLAKSPASTVQILGAEKALFRALKSKGNTPKYGLIYHSTFIGRAEAKNKGRISRYLANKCAIATRIDSFADEPSRVYGEKLREQVEERLRFYETGAAPRKNLDVMKEAALLTSTSTSTPTDENNKNRKSEGEDIEGSGKRKKKKSKGKSEDDDKNSLSVDDLPKEKKNKEMARKDDNDSAIDVTGKKRKSVGDSEDKSAKKKKKKKSKSGD